MTGNAAATVAIINEIERVTSLIDTAILRLKEGKAIDLAALEGRVEDLCGAVRELSQDEARHHIEDLKGIIISLDRLNMELNRQFQILTGAQSGPRPGQAADAYRKAEP